MLTECPVDPSNPGVYAAHALWRFCFSPLSWQFVIEADTVFGVWMKLVLFVFLVLIAAQLVGWIGSKIWWLLSLPYKRSLYRYRRLRKRRPLYRYRRRELPVAGRWRDLKDAAWDFYCAPADVHYRHQLERTLERLD